MNNWKSIWEQRTKSIEIESDPLENALKLNGYDSSTTGSLNLESLRPFLEDWIRKLGVETGDSIFEVGSGAGAFLEILRRVTGVSNLSGCDYSVDLVRAANKYFPALNIAVAEAVNFVVEPRVKHCVSFSTFFYFPDYKYAQQALTRMASKALVSISVFDVPDKDKIEESEEFRRGAYSEREYAIRYQGLPHLYFEKSWFEDVLNENGWDVEVEPQHIAGYNNSKYRFNVLATRR